MRSSHCFFIVAILMSHAAEFQLQFKAKVPDQTITSGQRVFNATATIPDMFIYSNYTSQQEKPEQAEQRRLKEIAPTPTRAPTPAPTTKVPLPVIFLIPPEGAQDKSVSLYGSQFNLDSQYTANIFEDLKNKLVSGKMAVIQYDKRNCKASAANMCTDLCPNVCAQTNEIDENVCNLDIGCYNDTNLTINDILSDAKQVFHQSIGQMKKYLDSNIVDISRIFPIPIGFSFQGAAIATYLASQSRSNTATAISLMGSSLPIDALLQMQLAHNMNANISAAAQQTMFAQLRATFDCIKNGSFADQKLVNVSNTFLNDAKSVSYWRDWLSLTAEIDYDSIVNFLSINSMNDMQVPPAAYVQLRGGDLFPLNATVELNTLNNINHFMIDLQDWKAGNWVVDEHVSEHVIQFANDICGYLDKTNEWILSNQSVVIEEVALLENDTVYKVLLYAAIMAIVLILACGIYFVIARKVCPYEFEDIRLSENDGDALDERERERERRRRHRRRRHRRHRRSQHRHVQVRDMVEMNNLNEPMIQSVLDEKEDENIGLDRVAAAVTTQTQESLNQYVD